MVHGSPWYPRVFLPPQQVYAIAFALIAEKTRKKRFAIVLKFRIEVRISCTNQGVEGWSYGWRIKVESEINNE